MNKAQSIDPAWYNYTYPKNLVAQTPARPRDSARLLVYDRKSCKAEFDTFKNILKYLPHRAVLVCNETKVVPARFFAYKPTGGKVELLYAGSSQNTFDALANRPLHVGNVLTISLDPAHKLQITVTKKLTKGFRFKPNFPMGSLFAVLDHHGVTPIPPYIKNTTLKEKQLRNQYQTVFAKSQGSSAAPTASLHFTKALLSKLRSAGVAIEYVTLHVGLGTFAPLTEQHIKTGKLHKERYEISTATIKRLESYKKRGRPIVAVGTTVARTLEAASDRYGKIIKPSGQTDLFIYPPHSFKYVDALITNFHVPKSSLMMLVASLVGREKLLELYALAIKKKMRLFSFGDGMLIK